MKKIIALLLAVMMLMSVCAACGSKDDSTAEAPAAPAADAAAQDAAAPDAAAPAAPAEGDASGEPSGEASANPPTPDFYEPTDAYTKDFEGYRQYVIDAFATDPGAPEELKESYNAEFNAMTDDTGTTVQALIGLGLICSYEDFLAY